MIEPEQFEQAQKMLQMAGKDIKAVMQEGPQHMKGKNMSKHTECVKEPE